MAGVLPRVIPFDIHRGADAMTICDPRPIIMWELTRACDLRCRNCVFENSERRVTNELTSYEAFRTVDQIVALHPRELILTGGDPLERSDVGQIIDYARRRGLDPALVMSPTTQLTADAIAMLARHGLSRMVFSLDGSTPEIHHPVHGSAGTFDPTLRAMRLAECAGMLLEVNTLVSRRNVNDLSAIVDLIRPFHVARWNVHFLVPVGGSRNVEMITAEETEAVFAQLDEVRAGEQFALRVVEAPHYRRFLLQRRLDESLEHADGTAVWPDFARYESDDRPQVRDAAIGGPGEFVYISHAGDVRPSEFLPQSAGNLRYRPLDSIYRASDFFVALRDEKNLNGKCGRCESRHVCGGSRARAWAMTGDVFGSDPLCAYQPGTHDLERFGNSAREMTT